MLKQRRTRRFTLGRVRAFSLILIPSINSFHTPPVDAQGQGLELITNSSQFFNSRDPRFFPVQAIESYSLISMAMRNFLRKNFYSSVSVWRQFRRSMEKARA
ncbi:hypothetical protein QN277_008832 [Acacia crassicarpa]|uniref:Uncharacterized protein n=1 Tax=Acacia crassicarpa TaxID=499986 RepID=A0AAE1IRC3_9FABA|nr:hypothetical protein QN277_008832 [Acacia crassicarpa]